MGQKIIGISSSGLHSNGYSLVRKICFEVLKLKIDDYVADLGTTIGEELLKPTKIYSDLILSIVRTHPAYAFAHITGGGINDNIIRVIPKACKAVIKAGSWDVPPIFKFLQDAGNITDLEMRRTFNNGIGLMAVVSEESAQPLLEMMNAMDEKAFIIGEIAGRKNDEPQVEWV
jgi:phosphoribosylformylglycinamidine cyclo-ligase